MREGGRILARIILPLSKAIIFTIGLYYAVGHWNSWFSAMIYFKDSDKYPLQMILRQIVIQTNDLREAAISGDFSSNAFIYRSDAPYNMGNINIPEVDKLYDESSAMLNDADRFAAYRQIDQLVQDNAGIVNLVWKNNILGYKKDLAVEDAYFYACGDINLDLKSFYFK